MRVADLLTAALFLLAGVVVVWDAVRLGIGWGTDGPKSGFFPFWLAVLMLLASVAILVQAVRARSPAPFVTRERLRPVLRVLVPATVLVVAMHWVGLYVASAFYVGYSMRAMGRHGWPAVLVVSIGVPLATFFVFERWFLVPMPKGPLETWLGY